MAASNTVDFRARLDGKEVMIARSLREAIVAGQYAPGSRLPTCVELESAYGVGTSTVSRALRVLQQEGFVQARRKVGTVVNAHLPHVHHLAMLFPCNPEHPEHSTSFVPASQFQRALKAAADRRKEHDTATRISYYYDCLGPRTDARYRALQQAVRTHRLGGLIMTMIHATGDAALMDPAVPSVMIGSSPTASAIPTVGADLAAFYPRAVTRLAQAGRQRIGFLSLRADHTEPYAQMAAACAAAGVATSRQLAQFPVQGSATSVRHALAAMLALPPGQRPDGLVVDDDHLAPDVALGIVAAGADVPRDLTLVIHANFPLPQRAQVPAHYLGYDAAALLAQCVASIAARQRGETVAPLTLVPALFEDELPRP